MPDPDPGATQRWTVYRRPRDFDSPWEALLSLEGTKRDALLAMQECERTALFEGQADALEFHAMPGERRPPPAAWPTFDPNRWH